MLQLLWYMLGFYVLFMLIWMVITTIIDIFRREDMSGIAKAGWVLLIVWLPLIGILAYIIAKPKYY